MNERRKLRKERALENARRSADDPVANLHGPVYRNEPDSFYRLLGGPADGKWLRIPDRWGGRVRIPLPIERKGLLTVSGSSPITLHREAIYTRMKIARGPRPWRRYWLMEMVYIYEPDARKLYRPMSPFEERWHLLHYLYRATREEK